MKKIILSFLLSSFVIIPTQAQTPDEILQITTQDAKGCENWTKKDWNAYLNNKLLVDRDGDQILIKIKQIEKMCKASYDKNKISMCTQRVVGYYKQFSMENTGMYSAVMSDKEYLASIPKEAAEIPPELSKEKGGLPQNWKELVAKKGWQYALFHSGTGDSTRLVIRVPGEKYDKLLVYYNSDNKNPNPKMFEGVQMQTIEKIKGAGSPKYYFQSFGFEEPEKTPKHIEYGGRCVQCHFGGPRAIVPVKNPNFKTEVGGVKSLSEFNRLLTSNNPPDLSPYYDVKNFPSKMKLGKDCKSCHDGSYRASLAYSVGYYGNFKLDEIHRKVAEEGTMPADGGYLNQIEQSKMFDGIAADHAVEFKKWLTDLCADKPVERNEKPVINKVKSAN